MVKVGIIGLGGMGNMHFGIYEGLPGAEVVALADVEEERLKPGASSTAFNLGEGAAVIDPQRHRTYSDPGELLRDPEVDLVDICLPTYLHAECTISAIEAGKNVLCEKPMALSTKECQRVLDALEGKDVKLMIAQCIRFWPEYAYLKETVESGRMGRLCSARFWRGCSSPDWTWRHWMKDAELSGGAVLDLNVHDADFVHYLLGRPKAVCSTGAIGPSGGYDIVETVYVYEDKISVCSGANMALPPAFGFEMRYLASFEKGCLAFSSANTPALMEIAESSSTHPELRHTDGYHEELAYLVKCIENDELPGVVTPESAAFSIELVEAEVRSIETGQVVEL